MASDSILSEANSFQYFFRYSGTGSLANIIPVVAGKASLSLTDDVPHPLMVLDFLAVEREGSGEGRSAPVSYIASRDSLYRFDFNESSMVSAPISASAAEIFDYPPASVMMELVIPHPFRDEITADSIAVLFPDTTGSEPCHVFKVYYAGGENAAIWHMSMNDLLPRAVERLHPEGGELLEIWDLAEPSVFIQAGEQAPDVFLAGVDGMVERLTFPRERPLLLLFFTPEGSNSLAAVGQVSLLIGENVDIRGISLMDPADMDFRLENLDIRFPIMVHGEELSEEYRLQVLPSAVLIAPDGTVVLSAEGSSEVNAQLLRSYLTTAIL